MFDALAGDDNSGVRIEAIDGLMAAFGAPQASSQQLQPPLDGRSLGILRDRMQNDPNSYVRQRSAAVLSQLASFEGEGSRP